ncbi:hypothetical protein [Nostoc parmelioides]|uniref:Uncharacterized protein n=1 Tax=Nostoc parmelioides FACHB-3921 TaxID=2692909 RepID=A0ABR8BEW8_9NOSO|nr:hypothetical protein [Nostoc parmelioides]MBD2252643.1 hypothetical protein [Nostoc parmelioides FACHB-3921]
MEESVFNSDNSGVNSFITDNLYQQLFITNNRSLPFDNLYPFVANNLSPDTNNLPGNNINPFAGNAGIHLQQLIFNRLQLVLGNNANNPFVGGGNPFVIGALPIGNGNRDFGNNNAIIGNFNSNYGSNNAIIGNGNWNFNTDNTTIGNGNWYFGSRNTTIGNGNWYWDYGTNNATLGNGNWQFGSNNLTIGNGNWYLDNGNNNTTLGNGNWYFGNDGTTIGNGNWDFGQNNTIIGNGNWIFTNNNTVIGNGNRLIDGNYINTNSNHSNDLDFFAQAMRTRINNIISSLTGRIGQDFIGLTENLSIEEAQTFNRLILARDHGINNNSLSSDIEEFVNLLSSVPFNHSPYQPAPNSQTIPEPTSSVSLIVVCMVCLLLSKLKKRSEIRN